MTSSFVLFLLVVVVCVLTLLLHNSNNGNNDKSVYIHSSLQGVAYAQAQDESPQVFSDSEGNLHVTSLYFNNNNNGNNNNNTSSVLLNGVDFANISTVQGEQTDVVSAVASSLDEHSAQASQQRAMLADIDLQTDYIACRMELKDQMAWPEFSLIQNLDTYLRVDYESAFLRVGETASSSWRWAGGVLASNGLVYGVPFTATTMLVINPDTNVVDTTSISVSPSSDTLGNLWFDGVLADNNKIYCPPSSEVTVLVIDPQNDNDTYFVDVPQRAASTATQNYWRGAAKTQHSRLIFAAPYDEWFVLIIDPADDSVDVSVPVNNANNAKWVGAVAGANGMIYFIPHSTTYTLRIDPTNNNMKSITVEGSAESTWWGGVLSPNGVISGFAHGGTRSFTINTVVADEINGSDNPLQGSPLWAGGVVTDAGIVIGMPYSGHNIFMTHLFRLEYSYPSITDAAMKWAGAVYVPNKDRVYGIPATYTHIVQMDLDPCKFCCS